MNQTAENVLRNLLLFCKGYESADRKLSDDYYALKKQIQEKYEEVKE